jgi:hypothetical protein
MPLRLFGAGSSRARSCPACERSVEVDATFCPSCYMVFRPEGAAALREFLQGARVPPDVYLLRKMQTEDPDAGPVTSAPSGQADVRQAAPAGPPPVPPVEGTPATPVTSAGPSVSAGPVVPNPPARLAAPEASDKREGQGGRSRTKSRNGVEGFLAFTAPLPPSVRTAEDLPALYAWMLEKDPVIPNNLVRLQEIHAEVFRDKPAARLGYEQHLLLQVAEDLSLYTTEDALGYHLAQLAAAYRRAGDAYRKAELEHAAVQHPLWQMASLATRMRLEAWVYHARHGEWPQLLNARQRELPLKFPEH